MRAAITLALVVSSLLVFGSSGASAQAFEPGNYIGQGDKYNCDAFASQAQAQQVLRFDPSDPNKLYQGGTIGVACETFAYADTSRDENPVQSPTPAGTSTGNEAVTGDAEATGTGNSTGNNSSTSTSTEVRSPTNTSTEATTTGNVTVTGGAGDGNTTVNIYTNPQTGGAAPTGASGAPANPAAVAGIGCQYVLGFALLHNLIPTIVGPCLNNERHNGENGDGLQDTGGGAAGGLMVWRKADNWTAYTDGHRTWINGPYGIAQRLNTQRYTWEANPDNLPTPS